MKCVYMYSLHVVLCCVLHVHMFTSEYVHCVFDYVFNTCLSGHSCILLHDYTYQVNQTLPDRIIVFRDGVGDVHCCGV